MEFCWTVTVKTCEEIDEQMQTNLDIDITVLADSESGSYDLFACGQEVDEEIELRTFRCGEAEIETCFSQDPFIEVEDVSCFGQMDGSFTVDNVDTDALSNILIYNLNDQLIEAFIDVELPYTIPNILDTGYYGVILETPGIGEEGFCEGTLSTIIKVEGPFETFARITEPEECLVDSVQLLASSWPNTLDGFTYQWIGPNDFFTTEQNPVVTESGEYILTTIRNNCRVSDTINIVLGEGLAVSAGYLDEIPCLGNDLILTATGNPAVDEYQWVLPPGSSLLSPTYDGGTNSWNFGPISASTNIQLIGLDTDNGCTDTTSFFAEVIAPPVLNYQALVEDCPSNEIVVTIEQGTDITSVLWLDDNTTMNPRTFSDLPVGEEVIVAVQITNSQGCTTEGSVSLVGPGVTMSVDTPLLCPGELATLTSSTANSYLWSTGDTTNSIVVAPEPGTSTAYSITITDAYGCEQTASNTIETLPAPSAAFTFTEDDLSYQFEHLAPDHPDLNYWWNFGDGTFSINYAPLHTYGAAGNYTVSLVTMGSCGNDTSTQVIELVQAPIAAFTSDTPSGCVPLSVAFTSQSSGVEQYEWSFPGGVPEASSEPNPEVTYLDPGTYPVTLIVSNMVGSDTVNLADYITVGEFPSASFNYTADNLAVSFSSQLENANSFSWDFGDGNGSALLDPEHLYEIGGTYLVSLTAENECGPFTYTDTVVVSRPIPIVSFSTVDERRGCAPLEVDFINQSENALEYQWSFPGGDPSTSTETNPSVTYNTPGVYFVQLNAINESGSNALVAESYIEILAPPSGSFTSSTDELSVTFESTTEHVNTYFWDFGDGNNSTIDNPSHTYDSNGTYEVSLRLENECDTIVLTQSVAVMRALPVAAFTSESDLTGCAPLVLSFINQSTNADEYRWSFTGGTPSTSQEVNPTVTYDLPGLFPVELIAINESGEDQQIISGFVEVLSLPFAQINYQLEGLAAAFEADGEAVDTYFWDFGDGNTNETQNPMHTYTEEGTYTVELTVSNECGTVTQNLQIEVVITSVDDPSILDSQWGIYPNPTRGQLHLQFADWPYLSEHQISIYNSLGQLVQNQALELYEAGQNIPLDLYLPAGVYWLQLENEQGIKWPARKFIVQ